MQTSDRNLCFTNQFLAEKSQEDEPEKTNTEVEVQSMVTVPILLEGDLNLEEIPRTWFLLFSESCDLSCHLSVAHCVLVTEFCFHSHELTSVNLSVMHLISMADANINALEVLVAANSPPTRSDEQIAVDILKNTNFFKAFTTPSTIPTIYIQQFWDTIRFAKDKGYSCQLDEQCFYLTKSNLREALQLLQDNNNFTPPPNSNTIISFVNDMGYPNVVGTLSGIVTNDMYQPWRALTTIINLCLMGKTSAIERPRAPVLQILWGVVNRANIDYAERIWEEFTQCIHSFIEDRVNLDLHTEGKKKVNPLVILGVHFTKLIINQLQSKHKFHKRPGSPLHLPYEESALGYLKFSFKNTKRVRFGMVILDTLISENIRSATYYPEYVAKVAKYQWYLAGEVVSDNEAPTTKPAKGAKPKTTRKPKPQSPKTAPVAKPAASKISKSTSSQPPKPKPTPAKPQEKKRKLVLDAAKAPSQAKHSKAGKVSKKRKLQSTLQLVDEFIDEGVSADEPRFGDEEADMRKAVEESLKDAYGKGKEKVGEEQVAQVLLNLQTPKKKNSAEQFIF
ncbi:hypothetical protein Tco_0875269 [Tanacetum coccineum]|uniref:Uncharacterized protein n=1 Tax=Tanacetum coccineum TaxID=301880 RepID=A0ABQ5BSH6_9ASTR